MSKYISVYGTLRKEQRANYMMDKTEFIGESEEQLPFIMVDLGSFPALLQSKENNNITIETYLIGEDDNSTENRLDQYEGYPSFYDKIEIQLKSGIKSNVYFMK